MVNFEISNFSLSLHKDHGYYLTITGQPDDREHKIKLKKYLKRETAMDTIQKCMSGTIDMVVQGKFPQSEWEKNNDVFYWDFAIICNDY